MARPAADRSLVNHYALKIPLGRGRDGGGVACPRCGAEQAKASRPARRATSRHWGRRCTSRWRASRRLTRAHRCDSGRGGQRGPEPDAPRWPAGFRAAGQGPGGSPVRPKGPGLAGLAAGRGPPAPPTGAHSATGLGHAGPPAPARSLAGPAGTPTPPSPTAPAGRRQMPAFEPAQTPAWEPTGGPASRPLRLGAPVSDTQNNPVPSSPSSWRRRAGPHGIGEPAVDLGGDGFHR
jgi:hypothetical protein